MDSSNVNMSVSTSLTPNSPRRQYLRALRPAAIVAATTLWSTLWVSTLLSSVLAPTATATTTSTNGPTTTPFESPPEITLYQIEPSTQTKIVIEDAKPNSTVTLDPQTSNIDQLALVCISKHGPVQWKFYVNGHNWTPLLHVSYRRKLLRVNPISSEVNVKGNAQGRNSRSIEFFEAEVTLRGLRESQTGIYICEHVTSGSGTRINSSDGLWTNLFHVGGDDGAGTNQRNQFSFSYFDIRIPGQHLFLEATSDVLVKPTDASIDIWCQLSKPNVQLTLWKAVPKDGLTTIEPILINSHLLSTTTGNDNDNGDNGDKQQQSATATGIAIAQAQMQVGLFSLRNIDETFGQYFCTASEHNSTVTVTRWNNVDDRTSSDTPQSQSSLLPNTPEYPSTAYMAQLRMRQRVCECPTERPLLLSGGDLHFDSGTSTDCDDTWLKHLAHSNWKVVEFSAGKEMYECLSADDVARFGGSGIARRGQRQGYASGSSEVGEGDWDWHDLTVTVSEDTAAKDKKNGSGSGYSNMSIVLYGVGRGSGLTETFRIGVQRLRQPAGGLTGIEYLLHGGRFLDDDNEDGSISRSLSSDGANVNKVKEGEAGVEPDELWMWQQVSPNPTTTSISRTLIKAHWILRLNMTRIHRVHVFQAFSHDGGWKHYKASFVNDVPMSKFIYSSKIPMSVSTSESSASTLLTCDQRRRRHLLQVVCLMPFPLLLWFSRLS